MARTRQNRPPRNTAPLWKKLAVVLSAPVAVIVVVRALHATTWSFLPFFGLVIVVAVAVVWFLAKLLGVRLSLSSWD